MKRFLIVVAFVIVIIVGGVGYSRWKSRLQLEGQAAYLCIDNLRKIDTTKESYAHEHGLKEGDVIPIQALIDGRAWPLKCPSGGDYTINPMGQEPACSVRRHKLRP